MIYQSSCYIPLIKKLGEPTLDMTRTDDAAAPRNPQHQCWLPPPRVASPTAGNQDVNIETRGVGMHGPVVVVPVIDSMHPEALEPVRPRPPNPSLFQ